MDPQNDPPSTAAVTPGGQLTPGGATLRTPTSTSAHALLKRELGLGSAIALGLGSIVGTGVFVSLGLAAQTAGNAVLAAIVVAALLALANGLSSAQLAANFQASGGTYEYAYRVLAPLWGQVAGWSFIAAKAASAAAAALGAAAYLLAPLGLAESHLARSAVALTLACAVTALVLNGLRRSVVVNAVLVSLTLITLASFVVVVGWDVLAGAAADRAATPVGMAPPASIDGFGWLQATALVFVAYTGYGRIATMAEEVHDPRRVIPRSMFAVLAVSAGLYVSVAGVAVLAVGAAQYGQLARSGAPLQRIAQLFDHELVAMLLAVGAATAMLGVLLNLVLGVSRVVLAMGRRNDLPPRFAELDTTHTPRAAILVTGSAIAVLTLLGDVKLPWAFSAFCVLVYYAIANVAALRLTRRQRLFPRWIAWSGLVGCLGLAGFVPGWALLAGVATICLGAMLSRSRSAIQTSR